jgi:hypothetical protein
MRSLTLEHVLAYFSMFFEPERGHKVGAWVALDTGQVIGPSEFVISLMFARPVQILGWALKTCSQAGSFMDFVSEN